MRPLSFLISAALLIGFVGTASARPDKHSTRHPNRVVSTVRPRPVQRPHVVYLRPNDVQIIRNYYARAPRRLPPGLQKKLARTGELPPGWQRKLRAFPIVVERRLTPLPPGYRRGFIDGYAVVYQPRTGVIVDLAEAYRR